MALLTIQVGSASQRIEVFIQDATTGLGKTGLAYNTSGLTAAYSLPGAAAVAITLVTLAAITTAWASGGFKEVDATKRPGVYRLDLPDAALTGARFVGVQLVLTGSFHVPVVIELTVFDNQSSVWNGLKGVVTGTIGTGSTTTSLVTTIILPAASVTDQFKGRIVTFAADTTTAALRGQATDITGSSSGGTLTVTALTTAPVAGDTFSVT